MCQQLFARATGQNVGMGALGTYPGYSPVPGQPDFPQVCSQVEESRVLLVHEGIHLTQLVRFECNKGRVVFEDQNTSIVALQGHPRAFDVGVETASFGALVVAVHYQKLDVQPTAFELTGQQRPAVSPTPETDAENAIYL